MKEQFGDKRRSEIVSRSPRTSRLEDLIAPQDMVVTFSHGGYVKSQPLADYRAQKRGGRGKQATATKEDDFIERLFVAHTHDYLLCFSNRGRVYWLKVYEVPQGSRISARQADRQHVPAGGGREDQRGAAGEGVRRGPLRLHGDRAGHGEEDPAVGVLAPAPERHHRRRTWTRATTWSAWRSPTASYDVMLFSDEGKAVRFERAATCAPMGRRRTRRARHDARRRASR